VFWEHLFFDCCLAFRRFAKKILLQLFQRGFILRNNILLRSKLCAFSVHNCFWSATHELLYFRFARPPPPKTAPQRRPKGTLSLTHFYFVKTTASTFPFNHHRIGNSAMYESPLTFKSISRI